MFAEDRWSAAPVEAEALAGLLGLVQGDAVLDACCGVGRHSIPLARNGFRVTGVDITGEFIEAARSTAEAEGLSPEFVTSDILCYSAQQKFQAVINMYTSFGYFPSQEEDLVFLKKMREHLLPGGKIMIETRGKEIAARDFIENEWYEKDGNYVLAHYSISDDFSLLFNRWILVTKEDRYDYSFAQRLYSAMEGKKMLSEAGYDDVEVYGSLIGAPYNEKAESLVLIGRRT